MSSSIYIVRYHYLSRISRTLASKKLKISYLIEFESKITFEYRLFHRFSSSNQKSLVSKPESINLVTLNRSKNLLESKLCQLISLPKKKKKIELNICLDVYKYT